MMCWDFGKLLGKCLLLVVSQEGSQCVSQQSRVMWVAVGMLGLAFLLRGHKP